jgi:FkbM family methyltransferase
MVKQSLKRLYQALPFKQQVFSLIKPLGPPERIYKHLHFKGVIRVKVSDTESFRMRHHGYLIENELFWRGLAGWERTSSALWIALCREARTIIDVGANTGVYTLMARSVNPTAEIVALEPIERVYRKLVDNLALNGHSVRALHAAASDHDGTMTIYDMPLEHVLSVSLNRGFYMPHQQQQLIEVPVTVRSLDSLTHELGWSRVDLVKIDTETHEPEVLKGMRTVLQRDRPTLLIEILNDDVAQRVEAILRGLGYLYFNIDEVSAPKPVDHLSRSAHYNFLVCQPAIAQHLGLR